VLLAMLLPKYWLRQRRLRRALVDYPIYDPPYKSEERTLPEEKALANFEYFLSVRQARVRFFSVWLAHEFGVAAGFDQRGLEQVLHWAQDYVCVLMPSDNFWLNATVFCAYARPWTNEYAGANVLFDFATMLGEAFIHHRPDLRWQMEWSLSDYQDIEKRVPRETMLVLRCRQRDIRALKQDVCSGYRRPLLASATDPVEYEDVFGCVMTYYGYVSTAATVEHAWKVFPMPKGLRPTTRSEYLKNWVHFALTRSNSSQMELVAARLNRRRHEDR
jgi:hypothetical protein